MPATIWFLVRLEMNSPTEMKQPPRSSSPRYAVTIGFHSGCRREEQPDVNQRDREHHRVERHRAEELAEDDLEVLTARSAAARSCTTLFSSVGSASLLIGMRKQDQDRRSERAAATIC
jgi:hypothetical protein